MKAGTDGKFYAWKHGDKKWYSFDEDPSQCVLPRHLSPGYWQGHRQKTDEAIALLKGLSLQPKKATAKSGSRFYQTLAAGLRSETRPTPIWFQPD